MKPPYEAISASEVSAYLDCPRKWAAHYVDDTWHEPVKVGVNTGSQLHGMAEDYCLHGRTPKEHTPISEMFVAGLPHMARPGAHWLIEKRLDQTIAGLPFQVKPDWHGPSDALPGAPSGLRAVKDYKTSVDPKAYGILTLHDREHRGFPVKGKLSDVQTLLYSYVLGGGQDTFFRHLYFEKTGQALMLEAQEHTDPVKRAKAEEKARKKSAKVRVFPSDAVLSAEAIRTQLERIVLPAADALYTIRSRGKRVDPLTLAPKVSSCEKYGGCPHRGRECKLSDAELLQAALGENTMADFNLFAALPPVNGPSASQVVPPPAAPPVAQAPAFSFSFAPQTASAPAQAAAAAVLPPGGSAFGVTNTGQDALHVGAPAQPSAAVAAIAACQPEFRVPDALTPDERHLNEASDSELGRAVRALFAAFKAAV